MQLSKEKRLEVIRKAMNNTYLGEWISPDFIYELRYDKKIDYGLERLFQRANHLITTFTAATEEQNFNFIFSGEKEKMSQWQGLYTTLPMLLLHCLNVIESLVRGFDDGKLKDLDSLRFRATIGYVLYVKSGVWSADFEPAYENFVKSFAETEIRCLGCRETVKIDTENLHNLYNEGLFVCQQCGYKTLFTGRKELLIVGHLMQGKINCPNCNSVVEASRGNIESAALNMKVICQGCKEEIELVDE